MKTSPGQVGPAEGEQEDRLETVALAEMKPQPPVIEDPAEEEAEAAQLAVLVALLPAQEVTIQMEQAVAPELPREQVMLARVPQVMEAVVAEEAEAVPGLPEDWAAQV